MNMLMAIVLAAHLYSVPSCEERHAAGYAVKVDGESAPVLAVRNSAMPVNIRWPGHQRELDQTEVGGLVRFSFSGTVKLDVSAPWDFKEVRIRPLSKGVSPTVSGRTVSFTLTRPGGYSVEFDGVHTNLLVLVDPPESGGVDPGGKDVIYFGPGKHEPGLITVKSGETLYIDEGAVVFGRVEARDADHIRILGRGVLDGSRVKAERIPIDPSLEAEQRRKGFAITNCRRWDEVLLEYCDDVLIDGITIRDSPLYNIRPVSCRGLTIRNVKLCGNWRYNSDGIDMHNCENVRISDCFIRTFDDSICVKGYDYRMDEREMLHDGYRHEVFTNAVIERCTIWNDWGRALEIGAETRAKAIRGIAFRDCDVLAVQDVALDVQNCDQAHVHDIAFENIRVEYDDPDAPKTVFSASAKDFDSASRRDLAPLAGVVIHYIPEYSKAGAENRGRTSNVAFRDIDVFAPSLPSGFCRGFDADHRVTGVTFENIRLNGRDVTDDFRAKVATNEFVDLAAPAASDAERNLRGRIRRAKLGWSK